MNPDGGPAFPINRSGYTEAVPPPNGMGGVGGMRCVAAFQCDGMSLRDAFAIAALPACMAHMAGLNREPHEVAEIVARSAYFVADALIVERAR